MAVGAVPSVVYYLERVADLGRGHYTGQAVVIIERIFVELFQLSNGYALITVLVYHPLNIATLCKLFQFRV